MIFNPILDDFSMILIMFLIILDINPIRQWMTQSINQSTNHPTSQCIQHVHSVTQLLSHSVTQSLNHWVTQPLSHSVTDSLSHSIAQPLCRKTWARPRNKWMEVTRVNKWNQRPITLHPNAYNTSNQSLSYLVTRSLNQSTPQSLSHWITQTLSHSVTESLSHSTPQSPSHWLTQ